MLALLPLWFLLAASWAASFVFIFKGLSIVPPLTLVSYQALFGALVLGGLVLSREGLRGAAAKAAEAWRVLGPAPVLALSGFYALQVLKRYSEGQSGSDVLFVLGLTPLFVLLLSSRRLRKASLLFYAIATLAAILGTVGILANWERPSSFSPFALFPLEESLLLVGGLCWAFFLTYVQKRADRLEPLVSGAVLLGGCGLLLAVASVGIGGPSALVISMPALRLTVMLGLLGAALGCYSWLSIARAASSPIRAAAPIHAVPVLLTFLILIDSAQGLTGPNPMIVRPVLAGSALVLAALAAILLQPWWRRSLGGGPGKEDSHRPLPRTPFSVAAVLFGLVSLVGASAALVLPVMSNSLTGELKAGLPFSAAWENLGYETAGPWLLLLAALTALAVSMRASRESLGRLRAAAAVLFVGALAVVAHPLSTSLFIAWRSWIPFDIQHQIGTHYVTFIQDPVSNVGFLVADAGLAAAMLAVIVKIVWKDHKTS
ncbi:MAG: hypothetical protein C4521_12250 [Actinobacteria bacterium]|nr:MAG: hypothetical protein C4521_12250 [Actinomycetota bacterium]